MIPSPALSFVSMSSSHSLKASNTVSGRLKGSVSFRLTHSFLNSTIYLYPLLASLAIHFLSRSLLSLVNFTISSNPSRPLFALRKILTGASRNLDNLNVNDFDVFLRFLLVCPHVLDSMNYVHSLVRTTEYCMLIVKPWLLLVSGCT
jgi:hypothetical protein